MEFLEIGLREVTAVRLGYAFIWVDDVRRTVRFYEEAFGFDRRFITDNDDLGLYAEMETGETALAIADTKEAQVLFSDGYRENSPEQPPAAFQLSFVTSDVEGAYHAAVQAGATSMSEPQLQPWAQTIARVRDPNGVLVSITTPIPTA